ncbi:MAG TPA: spore coat U domain-containing protein [Geopsychrobacteraceae bacterium]|nr:spore coat U domain-containing protein [Geopsychrobacteraceae bacterium]
MLLGGKPLRRQVPFRRNLLLILCLVILLPASASAFKCNITVTGVAFGSYNALAPATTSTTGDIGVTCNIKAKNKAAPLSVSVSISAGQSGSFSQRFMTDASGSMLNYNLYMDAGGGTIWGDGTGGSSNRIENVTQESPLNAKVYGRIPAGQNAPVGSYSDILTVTVLW